MKTTTPIRILTLAALLGGCQTAPLWKNAESPLVNAHRGSRAEYDDNAAGGFRKCLDAGVRGFETDVRLTRDDQLVIMHDQNVERTTTGTGDIHGMTLAQATALTLKKSGERVPSAAELAGVFRGRRDIRVEWEMKESGKSLGGTPERLALYCDKLYAIVTSTMEPGTYVFTSFHFDTLATMKTRHPDAPIAAITGDPLTNDFTDRAVALGCCGVAPRLNGSTRAAFDYAREKGLVTTPWMVQTYCDYARACALGGDTATSDLPIKLRAKVLARRRAVCVDPCGTLCANGSALPAANLAALRKIAAQYRLLLVDGPNTPLIRRELNGLPFDLLADRNALADHMRRNGYGENEVVFVTAKPVGNLDCIEITDPNEFPLQVSILLRPRN